MRSPRIIAILQALLVTFLWSTSWVFIKIGLNDIHLPALTFAGLRYIMAFLVLLIYGQFSNKLQFVRMLSQRDWFLLLALGIIFYTVTQGTQFLALVYLPSAMFSLMLNFTTVIVTLLSIKLLRENPTPIQLLGITIFLCGVLIYLYPVAFPAEILIGLIIGMISVLANAGGAILGRYVNRTSSVMPFIVTLVSMGFGAVILLSISLLTEDVPFIPIKGWLIILWMATINTAFAFTLWNVTLQTLSATESSIINSTMLIQIAILAWVFLGETINLKGIIGLALASAGIIIVQVWRQKQPMP